MNIAEAKHQIEDTVDGYLTQDETGAYLIPPQAQRPLFLLGAPGIGKTAIVGQVAAELGIGLVSYSMTHHTRQSALGLPFIVHRAYGTEEFDVSEYTMSEIIAAVYDYQEATGLTRGILFLDEINCVSETLYPSMLQFLQFKTFGRHRVPDGWIIVCAGNPPAYNKSVYDFDVVTLDRLRKIVVEPDLDAWKRYALATGVHPAVLSYLEVRPEHFYSVESTPSGKSFVTARGWDDLARVIALYEGKGKVVDRALVDQFIQDETIAERFAQYYLLFSKYRSDYRVVSILDGAVSQEIVSRAQSARFDERLAVLRMLLDALEGRFGAALEAETVVSVERDALRDKKEAILNGASIGDALESAAGTLLKRAARAAAGGTARDADLRCDRLAATRLREHIGACERARAMAGQEAFSLVEERYAAEVEAFRDRVGGAMRALEWAFAFVEEAFGDGREMMAFTAELTARPYAARFIGTFGSEAYYAHNDRLLASSSEASLLARLSELNLDEVARAAEAAAASESRKTCGACSC